MNILESFKKLTLMVELHVCSQMNQFKCLVCKIWLDL